MWQWRGAAALPANSHTDHIIIQTCHSSVGGLRFHLRTPALTMSSLRQKCLLQIDNRSKSDFVCVCVNSFFKGCSSRCGEGSSEVARPGF